jgi:hypothetical protein
MPVPAQPWTPAAARNAEDSADPEFSGLSMHRADRRRAGTEPSTFVTGNCDIHALQEESATTAKIFIVTVLNLCFPVVTEWFIPAPV